MIETKVFLTTDKGQGVQTTTYLASMQIEVDVAVKRRSCPYTSDPNAERADCVLISNLLISTVGLRSIGELGN